MLRTIFWYAAGWVYLIATSPALLWVKYLEKRGKEKERDLFANHFSRMLARGLYYLTGSTIEIKGLENIPSDSAVLFVCNHQSHLDSAVIHGFIDRRKGFIADKDVKNIPILSTWMKYMKCVFIDRTDMRHNVRSIEESLKILRGGCSMVIYPEGRLNQGKQPGEFRKGCVKLAVRAGVPIVSLTINNSYLLMTRDGSRIGSAAVQCIISPPIPADALKTHDEHTVLRQLRNTIAANIT